jgi:NAD(P) transhydrogenase subunit alpha
MSIDTLLLAAETAAMEPAMSEPGMAESALPLMAAITIFVLAMFVGFEIITKIPPTLHTPLMSGSNAISGITLVGAILAAGAGHNLFASILGLLAVILATINVVGGFLVTHRMLGMFRRKD